jgi:hypothetical protein
VRNGRVAHDDLRFETLHGAARIDTELFAEARTKPREGA